MKLILFAILFIFLPCIDGDGRLHPKRISRKQLYKDKNIIENDYWKNGPKPRDYSAEFEDSWDSFKRELRNKNDISDEDDSFDVDIPHHRKRIRARGIVETIEESIRQEEIESGVVIPTREKVMPRPLANNGNAGILVRVTNKAFQFAIANLRKLFEEEINGLPLPQFSRKLMRLNVTMFSPKITEFKIPDIDYEVLSTNSFQIKSRGGFIKLAGHYYATYHTVRTGQYKATLNNFLFNLGIKFARLFTGKIQLVDILCDGAIERADVTLTPKLLPEIEEGLEVIFATKVGNAICNKTKEFIEKIDQRFNKIIEKSPFIVEMDAVPNGLKLDTTVTDEAILTDRYLDIPIAGGFVAAGTRILPFQTTIISKSESDVGKMVYFYISDYALNSLFYQLVELGDFYLNFHRIDFFNKLLRLDCKEDEECFGSLMENIDGYLEDTGRMEARLRSTPDVEINAQGAHIGLSFSVTVSYKVSDGESRAVLLAFDMKLRLHIDRILIDSITDDNSNQRFQIGASVTIPELEVTSAVAYIRSLNRLATNLASYMQQKKDELEVVLQKNMHAEIPISLSRLFTVKSLSSEFRQDTLVLGFDMDIQEQLFEYFSLLSQP